MRNKYTLVLMAMVIAITGVFTTNVAEAAKRKVVIEDFTGAWCQACPQGILKIEQYEAQYGESVIAVGVHNRDGMTVQPYEQTASGNLAAYSSPQGMIISFPSAAVNRIEYNGKMANSSSLWDNIVTPRINQTVPVEVSLDLDFDRVSGDYTATITAVVESQVNSQLAFNLWAVEDYMSGTGSQWDQVNALNGNPNAGRFYGAGNPIKGFIHNNVFRGATGGVWGDTDGFPVGSVTPAGTYTKVYKGNARDLNVDDTFNSYFVAVVHNTSTKELINADLKGRTHSTESVPAATVNVAQSEFYKFIDEQTTKTSTIQIKNNIDSETNYFVLLKDNSVVPSNWDITFENHPVINANGTYDLNVTVDPKGNKGMATLRFRIMSQVEGVINQKVESEILFLAEGTERAIFQGADPNPTLMADVLDLLPNVKDTYARIPMNANQFAALESNYNNLFKTVVIPFYEGNVYFATAGGTDNLNAIKAMMDNGTNILLSAPSEMAVAGGAFQEITPSQDAINFFEKTIGVKYSGLQATLYNTQTRAYSQFPVAGISGDEVGNGVSFTLNRPQQVYRFIQFAHLMELTPGSNAIPFLELPNPQNPATNMNNKLAVRLENNGQRTIFLGVPIDAIEASVIVGVTNKMIEWLEGGTVQGAGPSISLSVDNIKYGEIEVNKTASESVQVTNKGDEPLIISEINLLKGTNFTVKAGTLPVTIDAGQTANLSVEFTPTAKQNYTDEITFVTNDTKNPEKVLNVQGVGLLFTSVPGEILDVFTMNVTPNPIVDNSEVRFNVKEGTSNVNIELIDATGKVVSNLFNGVTSGTQSVDLNASQLSSGSYYINANVDGQSTQLPVVITK